MKTPNQYKVIVEESEDGFFTAYVPALPGCHTQAKTRRKLMENIKEAIQLSVETAKKDPEERKAQEWLRTSPISVGIELVSV